MANCAVSTASACGESARRVRLASSCAREGGEGFQRRCFWVRCGRGARIDAAQRTTGRRPLTSFSAELRGSTPGRARGHRRERKPNANGADLARRAGGARACDLLVPLRQLQHLLRLRVEQLPLLDQRCKLLLRRLVAQRRRRRRRLLRLLVLHLHIKRILHAAGIARRLGRGRLGRRLCRKRLRRVLHLHRSAAHRRAGSGQRMPASSPLRAGRRRTRAFYGPHFLRPPSSQRVRSPRAARGPAELRRGACRRRDEGACARASLPRRALRFGARAARERPARRAQRR